MAYPRLAMRPIVLRFHAIATDDGISVVPGGNGRIIEDGDDPTAPTSARAKDIWVHGAGLWSTLYGFIALESDGNTVAGLGFYEHGETPGLGGEVADELRAELKCEPSLLEGRDAA